MLIFMGKSFLLIKPGITPAIVLYLPTPLLMEKHCIELNKGTQVVPGTPL